MPVGRVIHELTRARRDLRCAPVDEVPSRSFQVCVHRPLFLFISLLSGHAPAPRPAVIRFASTCSRHSDDKRDIAHCLATKSAHLPHPPHGKFCVQQRKHAVVRLAQEDARFARRALRHTDLEGVVHAAPLVDKMPALKISAMSEKATATRHEFDVLELMQQSSNVPMSFSKEVARPCTPVPRGSYWRRSMTPTARARRTFPVSSMARDLVTAVEPTHDFGGRLGAVHTRVASLYPRFEPPFSPNRQNYEPDDSGTPSPQYSPLAVIAGSVASENPRSACEIRFCLAGPRTSPQKLHPSLYFVTQQFWQQEHAGLGAVGEGDTRGWSAPVQGPHSTAPTTPHVLVVSCALEYDMWHPP